MIVARLEQALACTFRDRALLELALTHRSYSSPHNERLEFLGDAILNAVIARNCTIVSRPFPKAICHACAPIWFARTACTNRPCSLSLGDYLRLGEGEQKSGGQQRPSILADALEALFGALWLDAGFDAASAVIVRLYDGMLDQLFPGRTIKDAKTRLQEHLQGIRLALPQYSARRYRGRGARAAVPGRLRHRFAENPHRRAVAAAAGPPNRSPPSARWKVCNSHERSSYPD
jgi:ribonuclease-3